MQKRKLTINNKLGLHARAAAKFVGIASGFKSEIMIRLGNREVNGKKGWNEEGDEEKDTSHMGGNFLANLFGVKVPSLTDLFKGN